MWACVLKKLCLRPDEPCPRKKQTGISPEITVLWATYTDHSPPGSSPGDEGKQRKPCSISLLTQGDLPSCNLTEASPNFYCHDSPLGPGKHWHILIFSLKRAFNQKQAPQTLKQVRQRRTGHSRTISRTPKNSRGFNFYILHSSPQGTAQSAWTPGMLPIPPAKTQPDTWINGVQNPLNF